MARLGVAGSVGKGLARLDDEARQSSAGPGLSGFGMAGRHGSLWPCRSWSVLACHGMAGKVRQGIFW